jgi:hypothetical protein
MFNILIEELCWYNSVIGTDQWEAFYLFIAYFFATQIIGGAKELVVLL